MTIDKKKVHIMESVDILDRIDILVFQTHPGFFNVDFVCKEKGRRFVMDEDMLKAMGRKITDVCKKSEMKANPGEELEKTRGYIQEYAGRFVKECYKMDLAIIEDIPEGIDDHYKGLRNLKPRLD